MLDGSLANNLCSSVYNGVTSSWTMFKKIELCMGMLGGRKGSDKYYNIKKLKILTIFDIVTYIQCIQYIEAASQLIVCILEMYLVYITAPPSTSSLTTQRFLWTNACLILFIWWIFPVAPATTGAMSILPAIGHYAEKCKTVTILSTLLLNGQIL